MEYIKKSCIDLKLRDVLLQVAEAKCDKGDLEEITEDIENFTQMYEPVVQSIFNALESGKDILETINNDLDTLELYQQEQEECVENLYQTVQEESNKHCQIKQQIENLQLDNVLHENLINTINTNILKIEKEAVNYLEEFQKTEKKILLTRDALIETTSTIVPLEKKFEKLIESLQLKKSYLTNLNEQFEVEKKNRNDLFEKKKLLEEAKKKLLEEQKKRFDERQKEVERLKQEEERKKILEENRKVLEEESKKVAENEEREKLEAEKRKVAEIEEREKLEVENRKKVAEIEEREKLEVEKRKKVAQEEESKKAAEIEERQKIFEKQELVERRKSAEDLRCEIVKKNFCSQREKNRQQNNLLNKRKSLEKEIFFVDYHNNQTLQKFNEEQTQIEEEEENQLILDLMTEQREKAEKKARKSMEKIRRKSTDIKDKKLSQKQKYEEKVLMEAMEDEKKKNAEEKKNKKILEEIEKKKMLEDLKKKAKEEREERNRKRKAPPFSESFFRGRKQPIWASKTMNETTLDRTLNSDDDDFVLNDW